MTPDTASDKSRRRLVSLLVVVPLVVGGCTLTHAGAHVAAGKIAVVAAENEYGSVASEIGGRYVSVYSVESNPNTDPHDYEVSTGVASEISSADVVVENGLGYDAFMGKLESASPDPRRKTIVAQELLGLPDRTPNPHLWYRQETMKRVARALSADYGSIQPSHRSYFDKRLSRFLASLRPLAAKIDQLRARFWGDGVATTEPVADYLLERAGLKILTPFRLQADIMNGVDPSPEDVSFELSLLRDHKVKAFVYNDQVTDPLTKSFLEAARSAHVPVVGVYETMPVPGFDYVSWMLAEVAALRRALSNGTSTTRL